jgi:hypothetical protein
MFLQDRDLAGVIGAMFNHAVQKVRDGVIEAGDLFLKPRIVELSDVGSEGSIAFPHAFNC